MLGSFTGWIYLRISNKWFKVFKGKQIKGKQKCTLKRLIAQCMGGAIWAILQRNYTNEEVKVKPILK